MHTPDPKTRSDIAQGVGADPGADTGAHLDATLYHQLRARLQALEAAPVRDLPAIDAVIEALAAEQRRLKSADGQHGNNPIEKRHQEPPSM